MNVKQIRRQKKEQRPHLKTGVALRGMRVEARTSLRQAADHIGISHAQMGRVERGLELLAEDVAMQLIEFYADEAERKGIEL